MSYSRPVLPESFPEGSALECALYGMGVMISADKRVPDPNIEDTLISAVREELLHGGSRVLALATDWIEVHRDRINVDRLTRALESLSGEGNVKIYFTALAQWLVKSDRRFARLAHLYKGERRTFLSLPPDAPFSDLTGLLVTRAGGEDPRFANTCLKVPLGTIRRRPGKHILSAKELCKLHAPFRFRVMMGPSYRADLWAIYHQDPSLSAYEAAKRAYSSYETARQVKQDFELVRRVGSRAEPKSA